MKRYVKKCKEFYRTSRKELLEKYQLFISEYGKDKLPFELFVLVVCEEFSIELKKDEQYAETLYDWAAENWTVLSDRYIFQGLMNPSVRENYGVESDLFMFILWSYNQSQVEVTI